MAAFDDLPVLPPAAGWLLAGVLVCVWLVLRVRILRRRQALRSADDPGVPAPRWLHALAAGEWTLHVIGLVAILLAAVAVWLLI